MLLNKTVQNRDQVIVSFQIMSFTVRKHSFYLPVLVQRKPGRDSISVGHITVAEIVLGNDDRSSS